MKSPVIACLDVYYYNDYAKACAIVFTLDPLERVIAGYHVVVDSFGEDLDLDIKTSQYLE